MAKFAGNVEKIEVAFVKFPNILTSTSFANPVLAALDIHHLEMKNSLVTYCTIQISGYLVKIFFAEK